MWSYTPRQITAFCFLAQRRIDRESHQWVSNFLLANSDQKVLDKHMGQWEKELE